MKRHRVSPSQITTARACMRRWWWQSIKGFKSPPTASTIFGGKVHEALEHFLQHDDWPADLDPEVRARAEPAWNALIKEIGLPLDRFEVEGAWENFADYALPASGRFDLLLQDRNAVVDWKTTSDLKWAKSEQERQDDPQVIMYLDALVREGKLTLPATFHHVYTVTKGKPSAQVRTTVIDASQLSIGRDAINQTLRQMDAFVDTDDFTQVPANLLACRDFGGCPHFERCFPQTKDKNMSTSEINDVFSRRKKGMVNPPESAKPEAPMPAACVPTPAIAAGSESVVLFPDENSTKVLPQAPVQRVLFLGCAPLVASEACVLFDEWVQPFVAQAQERLKVPYWGLADFGKGKAAIVAGVAEAAGRGELPTRLVVDRRSALGDACAEILIPHYDLVVCKLG